MDYKLFNAILSMDAYNRGYNQGIFLGEFDGNGNPIAGSDINNVSIGIADIQFDSSLMLDTNNQRLDIPKSFYALAYDVGGVGSIISYRGTDNLLADTEYGYNTALGIPNTDQGVLAFAFYQMVADGVDPRYAPLELTGHSLGGGLAGMVAAVYGKNGILFDNMAFELSAQNTVNTSNTSFQNLVYGTATPWAATINSDPSISNIETHYLSDEFLAFNRSAQQTPQIEHNLPDETNLIPYWPDAFAQHSMSALIIHMFSETEIGGATAWEATAKYFWPLIFNNGFAEDIGMDILYGTNDASQNLAAILAYSAIDEGERPFGDTGIRALYDDANDLGAALTAAGSGSKIEGLATDISKVFVHFAGQLALNDVQTLGDNDATNDAMLDGILTYNPSAPQDGLMINLDMAYWDAMTGTTDNQYEYARSNMMAALQGAYTDFAAPAEINNIVISTQGGATGTDGNDALFGQDGNDTMRGGAGNDTLIGGLGHDTYIYDIGDGHDTIWDIWTENTTISFGSGINSADLAYDYDGTDLAISHNTDDIITLKDIGSDSAHNVTLEFALNYTMQLQFSDASNIYGTSSGDIIFAGAGNNTIYGYAGNDVIYGGAGHDILIGGAHNDRLYGGSGTDQYVIPGNTTYIYEEGSDIDFLIIDNFSIPYNGIYFKETVIDGDAYLMITAGGQSTYISAEGGAIEYFIINGTSLDLLKIYDYFNHDAYWQNSYWDYAITSYNALNTLAAEIPGLSSPLVGDEMANSLTGSSDNDLLLGEGGDDILSGGAGNDVLNGGTGTDTASYATAAAGIIVDLFLGEASNDGDGGSDTLISIENVSGSAHNDHITGDDGDNVLYGNAGDDILIGGAGNDTLDGGDGIDTVDYSANTQGVEVNLFWNFADKDGDTIADDTLTSIENVIGSEFADDIIGSTAANTIWGNGGDDIITGNGSDDVLYGGDGNDIIFGKSGNDELYGDAGDDLLRGDSGDDYLYGGDGDDDIRGGDGNDVIYGGNDNDFLAGNAGDDLLNGGEGDDILRGGDGEDQLYGGSGNDLLHGQTDNDIIYSGDGDDVAYGGSGDDILYGDAGADVLFGDSGNDIIYGGTGNDRLRGGDGDDILIGGLGHDDLYGEGGSDTFVFLNGESLDVWDEIHDFDLSTDNDKIDISDLLSAYDPLNDLLQDFVQIIDNGTHSFLSVDVDGGADNFVQIARINFVTGITDEAALVANGNLIV